MIRIYDIIIFLEFSSLLSLIESWEINIEKNIIFNNSIFQNAIYIISSYEKFSLVDTSITACQVISEVRILILASCCSYITNWEGDKGRSVWICFF